MHFTTVSNDREIDQILALQAANHVSAVDAETMRSQGFVTVRHERAVLAAMNAAAPSAIAKDGDVLAGYCLAMPPQFRHDVPILKPMFDMIDQLTWHGARLDDLANWMVMGQVCVAENFRGRGVFEGMYHALRDAYRNRFDLLITEISARNTRSLRAHEKVGFQDLHIYPDLTTGETWHLVVWPW